MNTSRNRSSIIYLLLFVAIIAMVVYNFQQQATAQEILAINQVAADIQSGIVERIVVESDNRLRIIRADDVRNRMRAIYFQAIGTTPEGLARLMREGAPGRTPCAGGP